MDLDEEKETALDNESEQIQDSELEKEEEKKKARLRTRGPYRKAHANWWFWKRIEDTGRKVRLQEPRNQGIVKNAVNYDISRYLVNNFVAVQESA